MEIKMGKYKLLLRSAIKKQKSTLIGIFLLVFMLSLCLFSALTVYLSGTKSVREEMERLGFGDFTVWVSGQPDNLSETVSALRDVDHVTVQPLIFAGYAIKGSHSDNEGQLLTPDRIVPYHFIDEDGERLESVEIKGESGERLESMEIKEESGERSESIEIKGESGERLENIEIKDEDGERLESAGIKDKGGERSESIEKDASGKRLENIEIKPGEVYISPAMRSSYDVSVGDTVTFELSRKDGTRELTVAGYFEDAFMGSSMIDMKSFLISADDWNEMRSVVDTAAEVDALGRSGAMLHIFQSEDSALSAQEFQKELSESSDIALYTEFSYRRESIQNYMILLQNILTGFLIAFSVVLLIICLVVIGHNLSVVVEQEKQEMAVLKSMGMPGRGIRGTYLFLYGGVAFLGLFGGLFPAWLTANSLVRAMVTSTGMLIRLYFPASLILPLLMVLLGVFVVYITLRTGKILRIAPVQTMRETGGERKVKSHLRGRFLALDIAVREIRSGKRRYTAVCLISVFLALFLSVIGKMGTWLGPNGEGLMNTFSVADHDLGVQPFNDTVPMDEIERIINWYSPVRETYELAMQNVTVNGQQYTANVLDDTRWFHVLSGDVCDENSILITDTVANELSLSVGDPVQITSGGRMETYIVSGTYQCANGMGTNIGMSLEGYAKIGDVSGYIWCHHYILENGGVRDYAMKYLQEHYRGVDVHTNSWSGLDGIVSTMHMLIALIYLIAAVFILIAVWLAANKLMQTETEKMAVYKSMGLSHLRLRLSFALRFFLVVLLGTAAGVIISEVFADSVIAKIVQSFGIGEFHSGFSILGTLVPLAVLPLLFFGFALAFSSKLKRVSITNLISKYEE